MRKQTYRRRAIRLGLLTTNFAILAVIVFFILQNPKAASNTQKLSASGAPTAAQANPLDQVSSADIALTVARMSSLPEATAVSNQAQSQAAEVVIASSSNNVVSKPQVIATSLKSVDDIKNYTVVPGDTISKIAAKFGITSDSVRWSNGLSGDAVAVGTHLVIPPVNGFVYTVKNGDTADSLASRFHSSKDKIIGYNNAEIKGLVSGQRILIPDGSKTVTTSGYRQAVYGAVAWGINPIYGYNGYDYGYCTWYVATRIAVPANWGNANTWAYYATASGWRVSKRPVAGSIGQTTGPGYGHVAVVEAVSADGTMIKYSDMNGLAGWGRVGTTPDWVPASHFNNFIYR